MEAALAVAVTIYGVFMAAAPIIQIRVILRNRSSQDVSLGYFGVLLVGFALWFSYGVARDEIPLIVANAVAMTAASSLIAVALRFR